MLEPNGPLPPEIYWRRRALAIGAAVVVLALIVWIVLSIGGGDDDSESTAAAATSELTESSEAPTTAQSEDPSGTSGADSSSTTTASSTTSANPSKDCADQSLALKVTPDQPQYKAGDEPGFTIAITNIGTNACERDLGSGLQQVLVYSLDGANRLWSNVDCFPSSEPEVRTLEPGGQARFTVKWSAKTSAPGCTAPREPVAPGGYTVVGQLGSLKSNPEPFNIA
ncbi:hypothetical protein [Prescottella equi]|uniref:hypothetical protein n=1 Tax=Rhodococcus hoagii TaxID=43767 RepID=UPI000A122762|nr:hypothetical protein [Prescottella equi]ORL72381.1 hypothetical protein A5N71_22645 [Prescottella equi]